MESLLIAAVSAVVAAVVGFLMGRGQGVTSGRTLGLAEGRDEGRRAGLSEGREEGRLAGNEEGFEAGKAQGLEAGRTEGRRSGFDKGRAEGLEEGRRQGREEGRKAGFEEGRKAGLDEGQRRGHAAGLKEGRAEIADSVRGVEREAAMREAISRVSAYLTNTVRSPLEEVEADADADELRERIGRALGALQDLDYFIEDIQEHREGTDLVKLAQGVAREFAADQEIAVRISLGAATVHADVNPPALMDALYLLLHNAGRFGQGATIDLTVLNENGSSVIRIRDRGQGFSEEAFRRAFDPFYSTSADGLGLGLPHARKVIEGMGGTIELRNVPDGGAEVELSFPGR